MQQPGCPNLYWALTDLPCPLVDLRKGVQGDRTLVAAELRLLHDDAPMTETEIEEFVSHLSGVMSFAREQAGQPPRSVRARLQARVKDPERVRAARRRLVEAGYAPDLVKKFPPLQVILLDEKRDYEVQRDERMKLLALPLWQIDSLAGGKERAAEAGRAVRGSPAPHRQAPPDPGTAGAADRPACGTSRRCACTPRSTTASCLRSCPTSPCRCPSTRSPASRSFIRSRERPPTPRQFALRAEEKDPGSSVHYEVTLQK